MKLTQISDTLLDEASSPAHLREALDAFAQLCSDVGGVVPDRSVVFVRAVYAALIVVRQRFANGPIVVMNECL